nr:hypothetical protein [Escherichia coli]
MIIFAPYQVHWPCAAIASWENIMEQQPGSQREPGKHIQTRQFRKTTSFDGST